MKKYYILILTTILILQISCSEDPPTFSDSSQDQNNLPAISNGNIDILSDHELQLSWQKQDVDSNNNDEITEINNFIIERRAASEQSFQIINAGLDRKLGSGDASRGGDDADNVVHFSSRTVEDLLVTN